jgi:PAS domain S-box-containing protein
VIVEMTGTENQIAWLNDPRLATHALSPSPVWLWSIDARRILWANPVASAIFNAGTPGETKGIAFEPGDPAAAQIERLANTLPQGGVPRLERLRGFGASLGGALVCMCSRLTLADNDAAILVVSTERAGKELVLAERARRLLADMTAPTALFTADGEWVDGSRDALARLGGARELAALGADRLAREATLNGHATGNIAAGPAVMLRMGAGATFLLLLVLPQEPHTAPAAEPLHEAPPVAANAADGAAASESRNGAAATPVGQLTPPMPLRFVWQMDAANRFTHGVADFERLLGPKAAAAFAEPWSEIAAKLSLDPDGRIAKALAAHDTWSGIAVDWPAGGTGERLTIEMSGLPMFDRDRQFCGYRGFAICRDAERFTTLEAHRSAAPEQQPAKPEIPDEPAKIVPFRAAPPPPAAERPAPVLTESAPALSPGEHSAFQELARELSERLKNGPVSAVTDVPSEPFVAPAPPPVPPAPPPRAVRNGDAARDTQEGRPILDKLPVGILVYRLNNLLYANRAFLAWTGYPDLEALREAGGLDSLFIEAADPSPAVEGTNGARTLTITTINGNQKPVEGRLFSVAWNSENALVLMLNTQTAAGEQQARANDAALRRLEGENRALKAILDTATDGVLVLDRAGRVLSANRSAQALFGYESAELTDLSLSDLLAPESRRSVLDYLDRLAVGSGAGMLDAGREAIGRVRQGGLVPLFITIGRIEGGEKLCAVLRDVTAWKRTEEELTNARQEAEKSSTAKSEFLARISHEIRTPLNAIIGFSEVMMDERFGPIANDRYRQYLKDIHSSGAHVISLINDLLDLSKIEAGKLDLSFVSVDLNETMRQCVAIMQPEANRERVIIRTALPKNVPPVVADARSVRQIALNLLSNSIKFSGACGQVIVSTTVTDTNEVVLRVRDTGHGMSEKDLATALEPFRQIAISSRPDASGTGLGLPITKALAEANHAHFRITSRVEDGTLVEITFPATRVLMQ